MVRRRHADGSEGQVTDESTEKTNKVVLIDILAKMDISQQTR